MDESDVDESNDTANKCLKSDDEEPDEEERDGLEFDGHDGLSIHRENGANQAHQDDSISLADDVRLNTGNGSEYNQRIRLTARGEAFDDERWNLDSLDSKILELSFEYESLFEETGAGAASLQTASACDHEERPAKKDIEGNLEDNTEVNEWLDHDELEKLFFGLPKLPSQSPPRSPLSSASSHSLNKSYLRSNASIETIDTEKIIPDRLEEQDDRQLLIPRYKQNSTNEYRWPCDTLPLGGNGRFDEGIQWFKNVEPIGGGASGECYTASIRPIQTGQQEIDEEDQYVRLFCAKKVLRRYNREELVSLYLSGQSRFKNKLDGSENIVQFYGATISRSEVYIFMKLMEAGTVGDLIQKYTDVNGIIPKQDCLDYLADVMSALKFLHGNGILHNDVKASNVLLDSYRLRARLADFGNASPMSNENAANESRRDTWGACCFMLEMLGNWCDSPLLDTPLLMRRSDVQSLLPHPDETHTTDILNLFINNNDNIYTRIIGIASNYNKEQLNRLRIENL